MRSAIFAVLALLVCGVAMADNIVIDNPSFETTNPLNISCGTGCAYNDGPIPGWTITGAASGSWMLNSTYYSSPAPDGSIVAYDNGGTISQTLPGVSLLPNSIYTLSVYIGDRLDSDFSGYSFSLDAGSTVLSTFSGWNYMIPMGTFQQEFLTFTTGDSVAAGNLGISLTSNGPQTDFDDVQLNVVPTFQSNGDLVITPEPSTFLLLGMGLFGVLGLTIRRRAEA